MESKKKDIVLVDDECALCNKSVNFIIRKGGEEYFRFLSLYSDEGKALLRKYHLPRDYSESVVLIHGENVYLKSGAFLRISKHLGGVYPLLYWLKIIPRRLRDAVYDMVAKHRHHL